MAKQYFESHQIGGFEKIVVNPALPEGQEQIASVISQLQQAIPAMIEQGVQQAVQTAMQMPESQKMVAETAKIAAETGQIEAAVEEKAWNVANKVDAEERREEADVEKAAAARDTADTADWKAREDIRLRERELEITDSKQLDKATETKTTTVVSP